MKRIDASARAAILAALRDGTSTRDLSKRYKIGQGAIKELAAEAGLVVDARAGGRAGARDVKPARAPAAPLARTMQDLQPRAARAIPKFAHWTLDQLAGAPGSAGPETYDPKQLEYHLRNLKHLGEICPEVLVRVRGEDDHDEAPTEDAAVEMLKQLPIRYLLRALREMGVPE
jgi:hypothetical protein